MVWYFKYSLEWKESRGSACPHPNQYGPKQELYQIPEYLTKKMDENLPQMQSLPF